IVLPLEIERLARHFEEGEAGAVIHLEECVETLAAADFEGADQAQAEKILIEDPRLLGIAAAIRVMVQTLDHASLQLRSVIPAEAGIHFGRRRSGWSMDPGLRRDDNWWDGAVHCGTLKKDADV